MKKSIVSITGVPEKQAKENGEEEISSDNDGEPSRLNE